MPVRIGLFRFLEVASHLLTVTNFSVHPFHLVIVVLTCQSDLANVNGAVG